MYRLCSCLSIPLHSWTWRLYSQTVAKLLYIHNVVYRKVFLFPFCCFLMPPLSCWKCLLWFLAKYFIFNFVVWSFLPAIDEDTVKKAWSHFVSLCCYLSTRCYIHANIFWMWMEETQNCLLNTEAMNRALDFIELLIMPKSRTALLWIFKVTVGS